MTLRSRIYRAFCRFILGPSIAYFRHDINRLSGPVAHAQKEFLLLNQWQSQMTASPEAAVRQGGAVSSKLQIVFFHAASVGELEALTPVIEKLIAQLKIQAQLEQWIFVISVFSYSAFSLLKKLERRLREDFKGELRLVVGLSPVEGEWDQLFSRFPASPRFFMTVKYEAWPELWMTLCQRKVPLVILNSLFRPSIQNCARLLWFLGEQSPQVHFLTDHQKLIPELGTKLKKYFKKSQFIITGDPRWDRVLAIREGLHLQTRGRVQQLLEVVSTKNRKWVQPDQVQIFGFAQVWPEDRLLIAHALKHLDEAHLVWIIPHLVNPQTTIQWKEWLLEQGVSFMVSSEGSSGGSAEAFSNTFGEEKALGPKSSDGNTQIRVLLVNEMGILNQAYPHFYATYIGGGLGAGPHSTIEPALAGIPIACGPNRVEKFYETTYLAEVGQLSIIHSREEFGSWLVGRGAFADGQKRCWDHLAQFGASERVLVALKPFLAL